MTKIQLMRIALDNMALMFGGVITLQLHPITIRSTFRSILVQEFLESRAFF